MLPWKTNKYSECVSVTLVIQHAKRMRRIILLSVACLAVLNFFTLSHKRHDFLKKLLNIKCVFWFCLQLLSEKFLIVRRIQRDIIINLHKSSCKVPLLLSDLMKTRIFSIDFPKIFKNQITLKSIQWERIFSMRTDGQRDRHTDMTKLFFSILRKCLKMT